MNSNEKKKHAIVWTLKRVFLYIFLSSLGQYDSEYLSDLIKPAEPPPPNKRGSTRRERQVTLRFFLSLHHSATAIAIASLTYLSHIFIIFFLKPSHLLLFFVIRTTLFNPILFALSLYIYCPKLFAYSASS